MRAAALAFLAGACALAGGAAHAGSLTVRDGNNAWTVNEDQSADSNDFVLRHLVNGTLPDELGNCRALKNLWVKGNKITGRLPDSVALLPKLEYLDIHANQMSGPLPAGNPQIRRIGWVG